jgi:ABC-type multidrug transport system fused ATPase/permease subunit
MKEFKNYKTIIQYIFFKGKKKMLLLILLNIISAFFEYITLALLVPYISLVTNKSTKTSKFYNQFKNLAANFNIKSDIVYFITFIFIIFIIFSLLTRIYANRFSNKFTVNIGTTICDDLFKKIMGQPYEYNIKNNSNYSISTINIKGGLVIYGVIQPILNLFSSSLIILAIFITLLFASWKVVSILTIFFTTFYLVFNLFFAKRMKINSYNISNYSNESFKILNEAFSGLRYIILNNSFNYFSKKYHQSNNTYLESQGSNMVISNLPKFILEGLLMITLIVILLFFYTNPFTSISLATIILFAISIQRILPIVQQSFFYYNSIRGNYDPLVDVLNIFQLETPIHFNNNNLKKEVHFNRSIEFKNIYFSYSNDNYILKNINFQINIGSKIGIIGPSGSGKSTLIDLLLGLIKPVNGYIQIDDNILNNELVESWRKNIGSVPQSIFINDQTVYENIAYGIPYENIDFAQVHNVAKKANIYHDILKMNNGFDTVVGDKGLTMSGGQRQRIGIARALYKNPKIIIFDEATSALDQENEKLIMDTIYKLDNITVIIITHRLSTLKFADMIFEIKNGSLYKIENYDA